MADVIDYTIFGDDLQLVEIALDPKEGVRAEAGTMTYMENGIEMQTSTGGGIFQGLKRAVTGESFFITTFLNIGAAKSKVAFAAPYPGKIITLDLTQEGGRFICQKDSFLCAAQGIEVEVSFKNYLPAELLSYLSIVDRVDSHTIRFTGDDMLEVSRFLAFLGRYRPDISP